MCIDKYPREIPTKPNVYSVVMKICVLRQSPHVDQSLHRWITTTWTWSRAPVVIPGIITVPPCQQITSWNLNKMADISQAETRFWNAFSWMENILFWYKFHWRWFANAGLHWQIDFCTNSMPYIDDKQLWSGKLAHTIYDMRHPVSEWFSTDLKNTLQHSIKFTPPWALENGLWLVRRRVTLSTIKTECNITDCVNK